MQSHTQREDVTLIFSNQYFLPWVLWSIFNALFLNSSRFYFIRKETFLWPSFGNYFYLFILFLSESVRGNAHQIVLFLLTTTLIKTNKKAKEEEGTVRLLNLDSLSVPGQQSRQIQLSFPSVDMLTIFPDSLLPPFHDFPVDKEKLESCNYGVIKSRVLCWVNLFPSNGFSV